MAASVTAEAAVEAPAAVSGQVRVDSAVRLAAVAALWVSLLLVTYWWVVDGGVQDLAGWASGLTSLGRLSGLVAAVLLLAQVVLMARVPTLERAFGQDRLTGIHRLVGFTSFHLMLGHIVVITWGYAGGRLLGFLPELWDLTVDYPGMLLAAAGTACLVMVVVTSLRAARARLRYESWHLMHLYAYLGVGLALPHQLWTGTEFTQSTARTVFWWTVWGFTAGVVVVCRVGRPVVLNLRHRVRVTHVLPEGGNLWSIWLTGRHLDRLPVEAGQFLSWRFLAGPGWSRAHPYSLSAAPDGRRLRITVQGVGDGSLAVSGLRPGTRALVEGPYGRLTERPRTKQRLAFIGAGVGTAPLRALAEAVDYGPGEAVYLERFTSWPLFAQEVDWLAAHRGLHVLRLAGRRRAPDSWLPHGVGNVSDDRALSFWVPDIATRDVYVCGPDGWTSAVMAALVACGVPDDQIHLERFAW